MKTANLGDYLLWKGKVMKVVSINPGEKAINMKSIEHKVCPNCGADLGPVDIEIIEQSPLFQENAEPIPTIKK